MPDDSLSTNSSGVLAENLAFRSGSPDFKHDFSVYELPFNMSEMGLNNVLEIQLNNAQSDYFTEKLKESNAEGIISPLVLDGGVISKVRLSLICIKAPNGLVRFFIIPDAEMEKDGVQKPEVAQAFANNRLVKMGKIKVTDNVIEDAITYIRTQIYNNYDSFSFAPESVGSLPFVSTILENYKGQIERVLQLHLEPASVKNELVDVIAKYLMDYERSMRLRSPFNREERVVEVIKAIIEASKDLPKIIDLLYEAKTFNHIRFFEDEFTTLLENAIYNLKTTDFSLSTEYLESENLRNSIKSMFNFLQPPTKPAGATPFPAAAKSPAIAPVKSAVQASSPAPVPPTMAAEPVTTPENIVPWEDVEFAHEVSVSNLRDMEEGDIKLIKNPDGGKFVMYKVKNKILIKNMENKMGISGKGNGVLMAEYSDLFPNNGSFVISFDREIAIAKEKSKPTLSSDGTSTMLVKTVTLIYNGKTFYVMNSDGMFKQYSTSDLNIYDINKTTSDEVTISFKNKQEFRGGESYRFKIPEPAESALPEQLKNTITQYNAQVV